MININEIIERGIITLSDTSSPQQVGIDLSLKTGGVLMHGMSLNVDFNEEINLPDDVYSTFTQRSSLSRKGIFVTTGIYDPGYKGSCGCTIYNMSGKDLVLEEGQRVGQMMFFKADAASSYNGQWQGK